MIKLKKNQEKFKNKIKMIILSLLFMHGKMLTDA